MSAQGEAASAQCTSVRHPSFPDHMFHFWKVSFPPRTARDAVALVLSPFALPGHAIQSAILFALGQSDTFNLT